MPRHFSAIGLVLGFSAPVFLACSAEAPSPVAVGNSTGGSVSTGGTTGTPSTGGSVATGGATNPGTGGSANTGGSTSAGGSNATGGVTANGGAATTGGVTATGGAGGASTGGSTNAGASTGGAKSTGGSTSTGGSSTGGMGTGGSVGGAASKFSFFVTSYAALTRLSGTVDGFGGDLRYGETGDGAGLKGADKICTEIAEKAVPGSGAKGWRAFLSTPTVNAIDRIGNGPWYDRLGRLFSASKANLSGFRPSDADAAIKNDFPNENGVNNHDPDGTGKVDNHDSLTGSGADGKLYTGTTNPTCDGWTTKTGSAGKPRVGHSWPRTPSSSNTCMAGGPGGGGTATSGCYGHWMSSLDEAGCGAGVNLVEMGGPIASIPTVGSGGGYGGFYCFALSP